MNRKSSTYFRYILVALLVLALALAAGCAAQQKAADTNSKPAETGSKTADTAAADIYIRGADIKADDAKKLLVDGNARYTSGKVLDDDLSATKREDLVKNGQHPFAVIVSCSDSRVPPELLFDQGLGDIFIVRTAGNVVDPIAVGSVEYGVEHLKAPLVVVMGHSKCGAVKSTIDTMAKGGKFEGNIGAILTKVKPSVDKAKAAGAAGDALYQESENDNVKATIADLEKSPFLKELVEKKELTIIGAKYDVTTGQVTFFEEAK